MRMTIDNKLLYICIPGTRSQWIWECLGEQLISDINKLGENFDNPSWMMKNGKKRNEWPPHINNVNASASCKLLRNSYLKITTVRNPWERYVSLYEVIKRDPQHQMYQIAIEGGFTGFISSIATGRSTFDLAPQANWLFNNRAALDFDHIFKFEEPEKIQSFFIDRGYNFKNVATTSKPRDLSLYYKASTLGIVESLSWFDCTFFGYKRPVL